MREQRARELGAREERAQVRGREHIEERDFRLVRGGGGGGERGACCGARAEGGDDGADTRELFWAGLGMAWSRL